MLFLLTGCDPEAPASATSARDTLIIGIPSDPVNLLHPTASTTTEMNVADLLNAATVEVDFDCELGFEPGLFAAFEPQGETTTVRLAPGHAWDDGSPVTAEDILASWSVVAAAASASPRKEALGRLSGLPEVVDAQTLRFTFAAPLDPLTRQMTLSLGMTDHVAVKGVDPTALKTSPANVHPRSSGAWKLDQREPGRSLRFVPNPGWPVEGEPHLGALELRVIEDPTSRLLALKNHEVDLIEGVTPQDADELARDNPEIVLRRRGWRFVEFVAWNNIDPADLAAARVTPDARPDLARVRPHPLFGDPAVRRALTQAIDVDRILRLRLTSQVYGDVYGRPAVGTVSPALCGLHDDTIVRLHTDVAAAKAALAEAGWIDHNGDGTVDKDGSELRFPLMLGTGNPLRAEVAEFISEDLRKIGVDAHVEILDAATLQGRLRRKEFDAAITAFSASLIPDQATMWGRDAALNFGSWIDPEADALMAAAVAERDPTRATSLHHQWQRRLYEAQPYTFLYWRDDIVAVHSRFENTRIDIIYPWAETWKWTVAPERVLRPVP